MSSAAIFSFELFFLLLQLPLTPTTSRTLLILHKRFENTSTAELPTMNSVPDAWFPPLVCLNADKLEEQASTPTVDWRKGNVERRVYFNGTVTNELSQIR